ncbi:putative nuclease HARBI1 [Phymastichus coffea]|uniref:putative nuclease HARBI1 n=1 Tax=Phymastichus coffea TaxID=108790 RepID=UPI00273C4BDA|nr:putative nuclease HARBI1 [Phymastichus coffea]
MFPFMMGDHIFQQCYRMYPWVAIELIELLRPFLEDHSRGIPPHLQVLAVLRFLAEGSYQKGACYDLYHPMSQITFSKYLHHVVPAILRLSNLFVKFPSIREEREIVQQGFEERLGFPGVLGAIDCTLPKIRGPVDHEEAYLNYKHEHSFCVQTICDVNYNILNMRVCSGSTNDRFVWK